MLGHVVALTPWLFRLVVAGPISVVLVDAYFYTTAPRRFGVDPFVLEQSTDGGTLIDEYTALKELGLHAGRLTTLLFGAFVALTFSTSIALMCVFIFTALVTGVLSARSYSGV